MILKAPGELVPMTNRQLVIYESELNRFERLELPWLPRKTKLAYWRAANALELEYRRRGTQLVLPGAAP